MEGILLDTMFELPNLRGVEEVAINAEVVDGRAKPLYVHSSNGREAGEASA
jgi:ATP-dependent Clp protease ATP-binding subunit ClpX